MTAQEAASDGSSRIRFKKRRLQVADIRVVNRSVLRKAVAGTIVGNIIEWYEFGVFGYLITTMGPVFLPNSDSTVQALYLFGTFAATFLARPIGGIYFGRLGDKVGRRRTLTITLSVMAASTFATGLLPGYDVLGIWAAVTLVLLKLVQGFSASGEYTGGATFVSEHAPDRRRGFYTGFMGSSYLGFAFGAGLVAVLQVGLGQEAMRQYGWRIPFLVAGPLALIAAYFRYRIEESPTFAAILNEQESDNRQIQTRGIIDVIKARRRLILAVIGISATGNVIAYTLTSFTPDYLITSLKFTAVQGALVTFPLYVITAIGVQLFAGLSDKVGRKRILFLGSACTVLFPIPAFLLMSLDQAWSAVLGTALIAFPAMMFSSSFATTLPAQFPTTERSTALGLAYNVGNAAFGGTAPLVVTALLSTIGNKMIPAYYLITFGIVGAISVIFLAETAKKPLLGSLPNAESAEEAQHIVMTQNSNPLIDVESMPIPSIAFREASDGALVELDPKAPEVRRAARAAGVELVSTIDSGRPA